MMASIAPKQQKQKVLIKCPNCGNSISNHASGKQILFCSYCGTRLTESEVLISQAMKQDHEVEMTKLQHQQKLEQMEVATKLHRREELHDVKDLVQSSVLTSILTVLIGFLKALAATIAAILIIVGKIVGAAAGIGLGIYLVYLLLSAIL